MAVAKGAQIPSERLLDAVEATELARTVFELWSDMKAPALPPVAVDAMQVRLARWQNDLFGHVHRDDAIMALGVIEELGEAFDEDAGPEEAIDALGDVMVYAAQLCTANRLAVRPVIALAELYLKANHCRQQAITAAGMLAHVVGKHMQCTRGLGPAKAYRPRLVDALAMMIAKALEDCILGHELTVDAAGVFLVIGREVLERKQGDAMIPSAPPASVLAGADTVTVQRIEVTGDDPDRLARGLVDAFKDRDRKRADALEQLHGAAAVLEAPEAKAEGNVQAPTFKRLTSATECEACPIWDPVIGTWIESDEQLAARIRKQRADLSA